MDDITRSKPVQPVGPSSDITPNTPAPATQPVPSQTFSPQPVAPSPAMAEPLPSHQPPEIPDMKPAQKPKRKLPTAVILTVTFIVALLIGIVVFMYLENQTAEAPTGTSANTETQQTGIVTPEDVTEISDEIDADLKAVNDDIDFAESEISDSALQL